MPGRIARQRLPTREFIQEAIGQERTDVRTESSLTLFVYPSPLPNGNFIREVYSYNTALWGALFVEEHGDSRPFFEFVNMDKYSATTSKAQNQVRFAVNTAPRKYTPCFVVSPRDLGWRGWSPAASGFLELYELLSTQGNAFLDWLRENANEEHPTDRFPVWGKLYLLENEQRTPNLK